MRYLILSFLVLSFVVQAFAQKKWVLTTPKETIVVCKFSLIVADYQRTSVITGRNSYTIIVDQDSNGQTLINGKQAWQDAGWSIMQEFTLQKVTRTKNNTYDVELRSGNDNLKILFTDTVKDINAAFADLVFVGNLSSFKQTEYYQKNVVDRLLPKVFSGKLAIIPKNKQLEFIQNVNYNLQAIRGEDYKGKFYFVVSAGNDDVVYNSIQLNQAERTARTVEKMINAGLKEAVNLKEFDGIEGIKIELKVLYRDFLRETEFQNHADDIQAYFTLELLSAYKDAEITNQDLIDKSIILVNNNRVRVSLTNFN